MPKIAAATVAEHRAQVRERLIDAAEKILRADPPRPLTAGAVSAAAGIARNSIYRYIDTVDDLRTMVVNRYLPDWTTAVTAAVDTANDPRQRIVLWVHANLDQAARFGHGWLMEAGRRDDRTPAASAVDPEVVHAHSVLRGTLTDAWAELLGADPSRAAIASAFTVAVLDAGFRQIDAGQPADLVRELGGAAAKALVDGLTGIGDEAVEPKDRSRQEHQTSERFNSTRSR